MAMPLVSDLARKALGPGKTDAISADKLRVRTVDEGSLKGCDRLIQDLLLEGFDILRWCLALNYLLRELS